MDSEQLEYLVVFIFEWFLNLSYKVHRKLYGSLLKDYVKQWIWVLEYFNLELFNLLLANLFNDCSSEWKNFHAYDIVHLVLSCLLSLLRWHLTFDVIIFGFWIDIYYLRILRCLRTRLNFFFIRSACDLTSYLTNIFMIMSLIVMLLSHMSSQVGLIRIGCIAFDASVLTSFWF